ncbi:hypothetical protein GGR61_001240 [Xanthomonas arboricola]|nr:hypothetical protein [Xanthomonas sp. 3058]
MRAALLTRYVQIFYGVSGALNLQALHQVDAEARSSLQ